VPVYIPFFIKVKQEIYPPGYAMCFGGLFMFGFRNGRNSFTFALVQTVGCSLPDEYFLNVIIRINALIHIANSELSAFVTVTSKRHRLLQVIGKGGMTI